MLERFSGVFIVVMQGKLWQCKLSSVNVGSQAHKLINYYYLGWSVHGCPESV